MDFSWLGAREGQMRGRRTPYLTHGRTFGGSAGWVAPLGAGLLASQYPAQFMFERCQELLLSQRSASTLVCAQGVDVLLPDRTGEESAPVGNPLGEGSDPYQRVVSPAYVSSGAAPPIPAGCIDQTRTDGVKLNVPRRGER